MWQPDGAETTVRDIEVKFTEWDTELKNKGRSLDLGCVDYLCLLSPEKGMRGKEDVQNFTLIVKQARRMCLTFDGGRGLRVISPWQINRAGYNEAKKNSGKYDLPALAAAADCKKRRSHHQHECQSDSHTQSSFSFRPCLLWHTASTGFQTPLTGPASGVPMEQSAG